MAVIDDLRKAKDPVYQEIVEAELVKCAVIVLLEGNGVENHENRLRFAKSVFNNPTNYIASVAKLLTFNAIADNQIETTITANWNLLVGLL